MAFDHEIPERNSYKGKQIIKYVYICNIIKNNNYKKTKTTRLNYNQLILINYAK